MRLAHAAQPGQCLDGEILHIVPVDVFQRRGHRDRRGQPGTLAPGGDPHQLNAQRHEQPPHADRIVHLALLHLGQHGPDQRLHRRIFLRRKDVIMPLHGLLQQLAVGQRLGRKERPHQLERVQMQITPLARGAGVRPGRVRYIAGNDRHIPRPEGPLLPAEPQESAVTLTQADLQAVVEMQHAGRHVRDAPVLTAEHLDRKIGGQFIVAVLNDGARRPGHGGFSFRIEWPHYTPCPPKKPPFFAKNGDLCAVHTNQKCIICAKRTSLPGIHGRIVLNHGENAPRPNL